MFTSFQSNFHFSDDSIFEIQDPMIVASLYSIALKGLENTGQTVLPLVKNELYSLKQLCFHAVLNHPLLIERVKIPELKETLMKLSAMDKENCSQYQSILLKAILSLKNVSYPGLQVETFKTNFLVFINFHD